MKSFRLYKLKKEYIKKRSKRPKRLTFFGGSKFINFENIVIEDYKGDGGYGENYNEYLLFNNNIRLSYNIRTNGAVFKVSVKYKLTKKNYETAIKYIKENF